MISFLRKIKRRLRSGNAQQALLRMFRKYQRRNKFHRKPYRTRKVVLLRLDLIGDCTMFTSAATALRQMYRDREMTVVCLTVSKPVFERLGIFDRILCMDFKPHEVDFAKLKKLIRRLRKDRYDILLQPQTSKMRVADILAVAIKCNKRLAIETKIGNSPADWVEMVNPLYDKRIPIPKDAENTCEFDYYGAFVRGLGWEDYQTTKPCLSYKEQNFVEGRYCVFYPGGSYRQKFWLPERFGKLADHIYQKTGFHIVILGVASEQWVSDAVKEQISPIPRMSVIDLTGRTTISDVIDVIGNAEFVVSNDTSGVHIACATNTPSVAIAGGWHFNRFLPYHIENVKPGDHLPLVASTPMECYFCDLDWGKIEQVNAECFERLKAGKPLSCIEAVSYEQVEKLVDTIIAEQQSGS